MMLVRTQSLCDPRLDVFSALTNHQLRSVVEQERSIFVAETRWVVERALESGLHCVSVLVLEKKFAALSPLLERIPEDVPIYVLPSEEIEKLCGYRLTRGILAAFERPPEPDLAELVRNSRRIAVLEGLVDTTNVGAVFRSAAALSADAVILSPTCADPWCRRSVRVSMGTICQVPWAHARGPWPDALIGLLHEENYKIYSLALEDDAIPLGSAHLGSTDRLALFFGSEGYGLSKEVIEASDATVVIPMSHEVDSLNVAASSAVAFWELFARPGAKLGPACAKGAACR